MGRAFVRVGPVPGYDRGMVWLLTALTGCAPRLAAPAPPPSAPAEGLASELVVEGPLRARLSAWPADLVVLYGAEHKGSLETCGCPNRPRGSLARFEAFADAVRAAAPAVQVNAGHFLDDGLALDGGVRPDAAVINGWMARGLAAGDWDALNVGYPDVFGLRTLAEDDVRALPLVSANVKGPHVAAYRVVERGGVKVGFTGVTAPWPGGVEGGPWTIGPVADAAPVLEALAREVDVVVLLSYQAAEGAEALARSTGVVDVVVDAALHREQAEPRFVRGTAWVDAHYQTLRAGELRLDLDGGRVRAGLDRKVDLDPQMPDEPTLARLARQARGEIDAAQRAMYGP